jgi:dTDP-4-amino-4,6-dideoxygalactose transaminase
VAAFEKAFAQRHQVRNAIATTSCTTALHLALVALGIGPGDEVIVPAFTWVSTANVVLYCGATPVFADVDRESFNIDPNDVAQRLTQRTKAVIAVHLFGLCADIDALRGVLPENVIVVEDAACAAGGVYKQRSAGNLGRIAAFSFHPRKIITTGEGGMVTTDDDILAGTIQMLRNHGASMPEEVRHSGAQPHVLPDFNLLGFNYRMTDLQGAVGEVQLKKLDALLSERSRWAAWYRSALQEIEWLDLPEEPAQGRHAWQAFVTYVVPERAPITRNDLMDRLYQQGIATRPGTHSVHMLGYYRERFGLRPVDFPAARDCALNSMAIPLHNRMSEEDYHHIVNSIRQI